MSLYRKANGYRHFRPSLHPSDAALIARRQQERQEKIRAGIRADIARAHVAQTSVCSGHPSTLQNGETQNT